MGLVECQQPGSPNRMPTAPSAFEARWMAVPRFFSTVPEPALSRLEYAWIISAGTFMGRADGGAGFLLQGGGKTETV